MVQGLSREEANLRIKENKQLGIDEKIGEDFFILMHKKMQKCLLQNYLVKKICLNFKKSGAV